MHSHGPDDDIHFLRTMLTCLASVVIQFEQTGEQNAGPSCGWDKMKSGLYAGGLGKIHALQRVGDRPYEDSGTVTSVKFLGV